MSWSLLLLLTFEPLDKDQSSGTCIGDKKGSNYAYPVPRRSCKGMFRVQLVISAKHKSLKRLLSVNGGWQQSCKPLLARVVSKLWAWDSRSYERYSCFLPVNGSMATSVLTSHMYSASVFLQNTLVGEYPKLLRYLHTFFSRVAIHDGTALSEYSQRCVCHHV